jgi:hypothetical protein
MTRGEMNNFCLYASRMANISAMTLAKQQTRHANEYIQWQQCFLPTRKTLEIEIGEFHSVRRLTFR